ncbi:MAG: DUF2905 domain-containing protein [Bdellovibrionales bacterium]
MWAQLDPIAKFFIVSGIVLIVAGIAWQGGWIQGLRLGRLPGDIVIERQNMRLYFPLTTGILISVVLTVLAWLFQR